MSRILITGASGFVGTALCQALKSTKHPLRRIVGSSGDTAEEHDGTIALRITPTTEWAHALSGVSTVIHLAARVHKMNEVASDSLPLFRKVNTAGTLQLAKAAVQAGISRFVYLSTIKVNGEVTTDRPFCESMPATAVDPYAISKHEAELGLLRVSAESSMEVVIIRPSLVYGPGVKANFLRLLKLVDLGVPLPLAGTRNCRSLIAIDNLVDFIIKCIEHPAAANEIFLISDCEDLSTAELIQCIAKQFSRSSRLFPFPQPLLKLAAFALGKKSIFDRLTQSLQIDTTKAQRLMQWQPPLSVDEAMAKTVSWYLLHKTT